MFGRHDRRREGGEHHEDGLDPRTFWAMAGRGPRGGGRGHGGRGHGGDEGGGGGDGDGGNPFGGNPFRHFGPFRRFPWEGAQRGGPRARRGDIRAAILALLAEAPRNGYQIMQEVEQRSQGLWRPSPGSVYPALQQLEDEGLVKAEASGGGREFQLTEQGRAYAKEHAKELESPWAAVGREGGREEMIELWQQIGQVGSAVAQVARSGTDAQRAEAKKILADARRALYRLLAEDEG
ncbi:MAG: helix-turn-helix transcriptional regulator [Anaeromyxobacter sp.]